MIPRRNADDHQNDKKKIERVGYSTNERREPRLLTVRREKIAAMLFVQGGSYFVG